MNKLLILVAVSCHLCTVIIGDQLKDHFSFCMDALNHKEEPGPEGQLYGECTPWKDRACCTNETTKNIDMMHSYNFDFHHCSHIRPMSDKCRKHFKRDLCFYECEPNLGPWVIPVNNTKRKERFSKVPICASECEQWFEDCKDDYTCAKNWIKDFRWNQTNYCSDKCVTFKKMYNDAPNFCQLVWDGSWEYTADSEPCMKIWFDPANGNPNEAVMLSKIQRTKVAASTSLTHLSIFIFTVMFLLGLIMLVVFVKLRGRYRNGVLF